MNIKQSTLAAAVTAALAMGIAGQAMASVYGGSSLDISNLTVTVGNVTTGTSSTGFTFTTTNNATLNGVSAPAQSATCGGTPGLPGTTNNCTAGAGVPRLDANPANAPGGAPIRANNDFSLFGPGANQYSNADSVIYVSELTLDGPTHVQQIAESELQGGANANSRAEIQSSSGFILVFSTGDNGTLDLSFDADPYLRAAIINDPTFANGNAQANLNASFTLTNLAGDSISWAPQGSGAANDCVADFGTCVETDDTQDLNRNLSVSALGQDVSYSPAVGLTAFGISITGLASDTYTSNQLRRVPEPGVLALMGIGLFGLGMSARRNKKLA
jgi:hypothetical protein